jgi:predicted amidophosphoribosyltransferase
MSGQNVLRAVGSALKNLFSVPKCAGCGALLGERYALTATDEALCRDCRGAWEWAKLDACPTCGQGHYACRCAPQALREVLDRPLLQVVPYRPQRLRKDARMQTVAQLLYRLKEEKDRRLPRFFARQLAPGMRTLLDAYVDGDALLTFVPRGRKNRLRYGVDPAEELARALGEALGLEVRSLLVRGRSGREQKALDASARRENAQRSLVLRSGNLPPKGTPVIVVDDLVTTGASLAAAVAALEEAGYSVAFCAVVARTPEEESLRSS